MLCNMDYSWSMLNFHSGSCDLVWNRDGICYWPLLKPILPLTYTHFDTCMCVRTNTNPHRHANEARWRTCTLRHHGCVSTSAICHSRDSLINNTNRLGEGGEEDTKINSKRTRQRRRGKVASSSGSCVLLLLSPPLLPWQEMSNHLVVTGTRRTTASLP